VSRARAYIFITFLIVMGGAHISHAGEMSHGASLTGFGVQVKHERTTLEDLAKIKATGFEWVRFDMWWSAVEQTPGSYDWSVFDTFISNLHTQHIKAIIILSGGNPPYTGMTKLPSDNFFHSAAEPTPPTRPEDVKAFASFAAAAVARYNSQDLVWEIWNEPNDNLFWPPHSNPDAYDTLATQTCQAMRDVAPHAHIIGPALTGLPGIADRIRSGFLETFLHSSAATCFDALSFHPYRADDQSPESVRGDYDDLRAFISGHSPPV
jgi:polysaccharide biosynthesis protein PslG